MKKTVLFSFIIGLLFTSQAQVDKQNSYDVNFNTNQNDAMFLGGNDSMMTYIWKHLNYPEEAREKGISGEVQISFDINFDGRVMNFQKLSSLGYGLEDELIRVVKEMPLWVPASINGMKIRQQFVLSFPISRYNLKEE
ncbi:MAG: energy transducer TonB [Bacteroidales bacterium]|nr:energy transducer TonB [Bacteroidales bacterium]MDY0215984.1 energy transducer TonB [Bacteroidales bacterium]